MASTPDHCINSCYLALKQAAKAFFFDRWIYLTAVVHRAALNTADPLGMPIHLILGGHLE